MAEVPVNNWADLATELNAARDSEIVLTASIDLNDTLPEGITEYVGNTSYAKSLNGDGYKIKNLYASSLAGAVFRGNTGTNASQLAKRLNISNVDFDGIYLSGSSAAFAGVNLDNCYISAELTDTYLASTTKYTICGIKITGSGTTARLVQGTSASGDPPVFKFCNVELQGKFNYIALNLQNSYLSGEFEKTDDSKILTFKNSTIGVVNAKIKSGSDLLTTSSTLLLVNNDADMLNVPNRLTISPGIPVSTTELRLVSTLRNVYSFPIL